jgi:hypothetical protein
LGISLRRFPLKTMQDFASATTTIMAERADALLVGDSQFGYDRRRGGAPASSAQRKRCDRFSAPRPSAVRGNYSGVFGGCRPIVVMTNCFE